MLRYKGRAQGQVLGVRSTINSRSKDPYEQSTLRDLYLFERINFPQYQDNRRGSKKRIDTLPLCEF